jgi:hypothetical protein
MVENVVVFGNCQAETLGAGFQFIPGLTGGNHTYVRSFLISDEELATTLTDETREKCTILFEQSMSTVDISSRFEFPNARRIRFPSLDFNLPWPLRAHDRRTIPEPEFPYGRYVYGDRIINEIVENGLTGDEAWSYYVSRSADCMPNLDRLAEIERQRWAAIEAELEVKVADIIFDNLSDRRMFWNYNHPNREMLIRFGGRLLRAAGFAPEGDVEAAELMGRVITWEFGANYHEPIHPAVAEKLNLKWWSPNMLYRRHEIEMDRESWVRRQVAWE